ncbi:MAG: retroviral-like aspartic protease family protein [Pseudomonadota bacterium]
MVSLAAFPVLQINAADESVATPINEIQAPAEIKPEDFVYVAATTADRIGRVMAPVYVNGTGPFAFVVDTGASSSVMSPRLVSRLNLVADPKRAKLLRGITGSEVVSTVAVQKITAGEITLPQLEIPVVEARVFADADGIFGADAFARGCLYVNFAKSQVSILRTSCPRVDANWEVVHARLRFGGLAMVKARVGGVSVTAIIDTGAERSLGNQALLTALGLQAQAQDPASRRQIFAATADEVFGNIVATSTLRIGHSDIDNLRVVFGDFDVFRMWDVENAPAIVLGMDVLGTARAMMIDYRREEVRLLPPGEENTVRTRKPAIPPRLPP